MVRARGFSLIEMMLVVAILAVIAALAVPAMSPQVDEAKLEGTAEGVASLVWRAQSEAMASKRCVRVRLDGSDVVAERLNAYDCDVSPATAKKIDAGAAEWIEVARFRVAREGGTLTVEFSPVPAETSASALGGSEPDQIRFRPSGRLFSSDTTVSNDAGVLKVTNTDMSGGNTKKILVEDQGLICVLPRGTDPVDSGGKLTCP